MLPSQAKPPHWTPGYLPQLALCLHSCFFAILAPCGSLRNHSIMLIRSVKSLPCLKPSKWLPIMAIKMKTNQTLFQWPARPYRIKPWLLLQIHFPGSSPSPMSWSHWPSPISGSFHWLLLTTLFPSPSHGYLLDVHISTQTYSPLGGHFWPTLPRWSKHTTCNHSATWPHFIIAFTSIWHVIICLHAFSLYHPTRTAEGKLISQQS